jgi:hypothetical protein
VNETRPTPHEILARLRPAAPLAAARSGATFQPTINHSPSLPPIDWGAIGAQAPALMTTPAANLPSAAAVVMVWTDAEWAALEHVFCNSGAAMPYTSRNQGSWSGWQRYDLAAPLPAINNLTAGTTSVLTADSFVVGTSSGNLSQFACVKMDDAIIAKLCTAANVAFGSVRNISDPVQNVALPAEFQARWGQAIYDAYGFYTSYNGAIAAWAILSGQFQ